MRCLIWFVALCLPLAAITRVQDTIYFSGPGNVKATGYLIITNTTSWTTAGGFSVMPTTIRYNIPAPGVLNLQLQPNLGATPSGTSYRVEYYLDGAPPTQPVYWVIPDTPSTPVILSAIQQPTLPALGSFQAPAFQIVSYSATPVFDLSVANVFKITLTGDVTSQTFPNLLAGQTVTVTICQDGTGNHTWAWAARVHGGFVIGTQANKCNVQEFTSDGDNLLSKTVGVVNQ